VRAGLVKRAEDWLWSSALDHSGSLNAAVTANRIPAIDRRLSPADERTRISRESRRVSEERDSALPRFPLPVAKLWVR